MTFSCADALSEVESEFTSFPLETRSGKTVQLRNLLLLGDKGLRTATTILGAFGDVKDDSMSATDLMPKLRDLLNLIADKPSDMTKEMADWPLGMFMRVIAAWQEATGLGEAAESDS